MNARESAALDRWITGNGEGGRSMIDIRHPHPGGRGNKRTDPRPCVRCGELIPLDQARFANGKLRVRCTPCNRLAMQEWRAKDDNGRASKLRAYGLTPAEYDAMLVRQGGGCAICGGLNADGRALHVDHDHDCCPGWGSCGACVRGLLCSRCNQAVGLFRNDADLLRSAIAYLADYGENQFRSYPDDEVDAGEQSPEDAAEMERLANLDPEEVR